MPEVGSRREREYSRTHYSRRRWCGPVWLAVGWVVLVGCGAPDESDPSATMAEATRDAATFSVMSYSVGGFTYLDRNGDGQAAEMKPEP